jgi:hypothetical protein
LAPCGPELQKTLDCRAFCHCGPFLVLARCAPLTPIPVPKGTPPQGRGEFEFHYQLGNELLVAGRGEIKPHGSSLGQQPAFKASPSPSCTALQLLVVSC